MLDRTPRRKVAERWVHKRQKGDQVEHHADPED